MAALDEAISRENIVPFAEFVASRRRREAELIKAKLRPGKASAGRRRHPSRDEDDRGQSC